MQSAKGAAAKLVRHVGWGLLLVLGFATVQRNGVLEAAPNMTAVADAAKADDLSEIRKLIKDHADVNAPATDGSSALLWAAYHSDAELTKALLAAGAWVDTPNHYGREDKHRTWSPRMRIAPPGGPSIRAIRTPPPSSPCLDGTPP